MEAAAARRQMEGHSRRHKIRSRLLAAGFRAPFGSEDERRLSLPQRLDAGIYQQRKAAGAGNERDQIGVGIDRHLGQHHAHQRPARDIGEEGL